MQDMATNVPPKDASTPQLFAGVLEDARDLALGHFDRMRGEIGDELSNLKSMIRNTVIAVGVMVVGAVLAGHFLAIALIALGLPAWVSYGLAATIAIGTGIVVIKRLPGDRTNADLYPEESLADLQRDVRDVAHAVGK
jgi:hypothetical protein